MNTIGVAYKFNQMEDAKDKDDIDEDDTDTYFYC